MKRYMVIVEFNGNQQAEFFDTSGDACDYILDAADRVGASAELYRYDYDVQQQAGCYHRFA